MDYSLFLIVLETPASFHQNGNQGENGDAK
jgi:hypothetical protein